MLSGETVGVLENKLRAYEQDSGNEIAVVTVNDLQGTTVEDYAVRLFEKWKIGKTDKDNGALLLVAKEERKVRIEVGYGLEPELTDGEAFGIISKIITPAFKQGDFDGGISKGVDSMIAAVSPEGAAGIQDGSQGSSPSGSSKPDSFFKGLGSLLFPALFILFGLFQWFISVLGRTKSWWLGGVVGAVIGLFAMIASPLIGLVAMVFLTPLGLLFDFMVSRAYADSVNRSYGASANNAGNNAGANDSGLGSIPWWAGGYWGPGGFGGSRDGDSGGFSDFGGFGGGDSGGGGASGDW